MHRCRETKQSVQPVQRVQSIYIYILHKLECESLFLIYIYWFPWEAAGSEALHTSVPAKVHGIFGTKLAEATFQLSLPEQCFCCYLAFVLVCLARIAAPERPLHYPWSGS